ncbi:MULTISPECIES: hypothetical protein [unclassified Nocardia]|nr:MULTISPECIES: hypothetical protein [unclassified Nocardia]
MTRAPITATRDGRYSFALDEHDAKVDFITDVEDYVASFAELGYV